MSSRTAAYYLGLAEVNQKQGEKEDATENLLKAKKYAFSPWDRARLQDYLAANSTELKSLASATSRSDHRL